MTLMQWCSAEKFWQGSVSRGVEAGDEHCRSHTINHSVTVKKNADLELDKTDFRGNEENKEITQVKGTMYSAFGCNLVLQTNEEREV